MVILDSWQNKQARDLPHLTTDNTNRHASVASASPDDNDLDT